MVFKRQKLYQCILLGLIISQNVQAQFVPDEFKHFYEFEKNELYIVLPNDYTYVTTGFSNYYGINDLNDYNEFKTEIINSGIKEEYVDEVIKAVTSSENIDEEDGIRTKFSYETKTMTVEVPAIYLNEQSGKERYTNLSPDTNALIVGNQLFANYYGDSSSITVNSDITMGLGNGYISGNFTLDDDESDVSIDSSYIYYEHNINAMSLRLGYDEYGVDKNNSTSNLDYSNSKDNYYFSISSSDNLLISDKEQEKNIYFDIKGSGTVDIVRDGSVIYTQSFMKGQHGISYKHLPRGNYNVELVIRADGYPEEKVVRRINNNVAQTSHKGYDYNFTIRKSTYDETRINDRYFDDQLLYGDVSFTKSLFNDSMMLGVNNQTDGEDFGYGLLANYVNEWANISGYYNSVADGKFYNTSISALGFNFDFQRYNTNENNIVKMAPLQKAIYGSESFDQTTAAYSLPIASSSIRFYWSRIRSYGFDDRSGLDSTNLSINYNTNIFRNMQLNLGFTQTSNESFDRSDDVDNIYSASIAIPLGDNHTSYSSGVDSSSRTGQRLVNSLNYNDDEINFLDGVDINGNTSINSYIDGPQSEVSINGSFNASNEKFDSSAYVNLSNSSNSNLSLNLDSTSVITKDSFYQTKESSKSYVVVESTATGTDHKNEEDFGLLDMQVDSNYHTDKPLDSETKVVGLNDFSSYKFKVDSEISGFKSSKSNHDVKTEMFTYPGSIHKVSNKVDPVVSFLSYFQDFNGKALNDVKCIGDGCVSIGRVGDGIYSISLVIDKPFKVASDGEYCFVDAENIAKTKGGTRCFPRIETLDNGMQLVSKGFGNGDHNIYYLGVLEDKLPKSILSESEKHNIEYIRYRFANNTYLFAKSSVNLGINNDLEIAEKQIFEQVHNYVKNYDSKDFFAENR